MVYVVGSASDFTDSFPISPRQPLRKKVSKADGSGEVLVENVEYDATNSTCNLQDSDKNKVSVQPSPERQHKNSRSHIDRAKPRKSPCRPLPGKLKYFEYKIQLNNQVNLRLILRFRDCCQVSTIIFRIGIG